MRPSNVKEFLSVHESLKIQRQVQEQMSGSGRFSAEACHQGISILFPVDLRYGWDVNNPEHRKLQDMVRDKLKPLFTWSSPDCSQWSAINNLNDQKKVESARQSQLGMLEWLHQDNKIQALSKRGYGNENGLRSQIWIRSPLSK